MFLFALPLVVANIVAAIAPVTTWPPYGRRLLLAGDGVMLVALVIGALAPVEYDEWACLRDADRRT